MEIVQLQLRRNIYRNTNRAAVVEHCNVQNVRFSPLNQEIFLKYQFAKNTVFQDLQ